MVGMDLSRVDAMDARLKFSVCGPKRPCVVRLEAHRRKFWLPTKYAWLVEDSADCHD
jgi:hypothetical protein